MLPVRSVEAQRGSKEREGESHYREYLSAHSAFDAHCSDGVLVMDDE